MDTINEAIPITSEHAENKNCNKRYKPTTRIKKVIVNSIFCIPTYDNYNAFLNHRFSIIQLKNICKYYNLHITGTKQVLTNIIYKHLYLSYHAAIIQKIWKQYYVKIYARLHGPAQFKRHLCINETDFFTMDALTSIPYTQFFSYKDSDNMIYGYDIMSLYNLINSNDDINVLNPYTRNKLSNKILKDFNSLLYLSALLKEDVQLNMNAPEKNKVVVTGGGTFTEEDEGGDGPINYNIEYRALHLFHDMDTLGNYTNPVWFLDLRRHHLLTYIRDLHDIWTYRAHLTDQIKYEICPAGPPFNNIHLGDLTLLTFIELQHLILTLIELMIKPGINHNSRYLGSSYVLCALTLVSDSAAQALPWLYESVAAHI